MKLLSNHKFHGFDSVTNLKKYDCYVFLSTIISFFIIAVLLPFFNVIINLISLLLLVFVTTSISIIITAANHRQFIKIYATGVIMGIIFNICLKALMISSNNIQYYGFPRVYFKFVILLLLFHMMEFVCITLAKFNHGVLYSNYLLNPSDDYHYEIALMAVSCEFFIFSYLTPNLKFNICYYTDYFGLMVALIGDIIRKVAILQAGDNFSHLIEDTPKRCHKLVTDGIYSWCRHPSYVGWSMFAIGSQIMIGNVISVVISFMVIYNFFRDRITFEEALLLDTFHDNYRVYLQKTPFGYPFIS